MSRQAKSVERPPTRLTRLSLYALGSLALGFGIGVMLLRGRAFEPPILAAADGIIRGWTNAFRLLVVPFVAAHLFLAVAAPRIPPSRLRRLGLFAPVVFLALLTGTMLLSFLFTAWLMRLPVFGEISLGAEAVATPTGEGGSSSSSWVDLLVPPHLLGPLAADNMLAIMLFTIVFALAVRRLAAEQRLTLERVAGAVSGAMMVLVDWLFLAAPLVLLALGISLGARSGFRIGGALLGFTVLTSVVLLAALIALYPLTSLVGRVSLFTFTRAAWPAQVAAAATRSSLATVPTLIASGELELKLDPACTGYVIPLAGSLLKLSRAVTEPVTLLFVAGLLDIPLSLQQLVVFSGGMILLSTGTPGVPRMTSGVRSMPLYVAVGIPPEYVLLLAASTAVTDVLMTVLNSTGYLTAAVLVDRFAAEPLPAALPEPAAPLLIATNVPPGPEPTAHPPSPRNTSFS